MLFAKYLHFIVWEQECVCVVLVVAFCSHLCTRARSWREFAKSRFTHFPSILSVHVDSYAIFAICIKFGHTFFAFAQIIMLYIGIFCSRITFLETVAGVPGMVAGMARHLMSLRRMRRDHGWIHTLLGEWNSQGQIDELVYRFLPVSRFEFANSLSL